MTCPCHSIHFLFMIVISRRSFSPLPSIVVSAIADIAFIFIQMMIDPCLCDVPVRPFTCRKWTINPYYPTCFDADSHFIPKTSTLKLVTIPFWAERNWFLNPKICSINSNFASLIWIRQQISVFELNLYHQRCNLVIIN